MKAETTRLYFTARIDSTNLWAAREAEGGAAHGGLYVADSQTDGRGRRGRSWRSEGKGLYMSLLLRPPLRMRDAPRMTMLAAIGVCEAARALGVDAAIKWPNDVVARGKKLCGILCEARASEMDIDWCVLGTGINMTQRAEDFPEDFRERATSLRVETGGEIARDEFIGTYLRSLARWYDPCVRDEDAFFEAYRESVLTLGRRVRVWERGAAWEGMAVAVLRDGALEVETPSGARAIYAGDVSVRGEDGGYL